MVQTTSCPSSMIALKDQMKVEGFLFCNSQFQLDQGAAFGLLDGTGSVMKLASALMKNAPESLPFAQYTLSFH